MSKSGPNQVTWRMPLENGANLCAGWSRQVPENLCKPCAGASKICRDCANFVCNSRGTWGGGRVHMREHGTWSISLFGIFPQFYSSFRVKIGDFPFEPTFFGVSFFPFFCPVHPTLPQAIFFPKILSFWGLRPTLSSRETVLDGVAPQENKENPFFFFSGAQKKVSETSCFRSLRRPFSGVKTTNGKFGAPRPQQPVEMPLRQGENALRPQVASLQGSAEFLPKITIKQGKNGKRTNGSIFTRPQWPPHEGCLPRMCLHKSCAIF